MELGNILAKLRNQKGINQREFAKALGVSNGAVAMWKTNKRQPDLEMIKKISSFFNVPIDHLLGNDSPTNVISESQKKGYFFSFLMIVIKIYLLLESKPLLQKLVSQKKTL